MGRHHIENIGQCGYVAYVIFYVKATEKLLLLLQHMLFDSILKLGPRIWQKWGSLKDVSTNSRWQNLLTENEILFSVLCKTYTVNSHTIVISSRGLYVECLLYVFGP